MIITEVVICIWLMISLWWMVQLSTTDRKLKWYDYALGAPWLFLFWVLGKIFK